MVAACARGSFLVGNKSISGFQTCSRLRCLNDVKTALRASPRVIKFMRISLKYFYDLLCQHRIPPHFYEHHEPLMVPYNFDMGAAYGPSAFAGNDLHPQQFPIGHDTAALHKQGQLGSESNLVVANVSESGAPAAPNAAGLSAYSTVGNVDSWKSERE